MTEEDSAQAGANLSELSELLFDRHPLPAWIYDLNTLRFLAVNAAAVSFYKYTREEFHKMSILDIRPSEDRELLIRNVLASDTNEQTSGPWRHIRKDGNVVQVLIDSHSLTFKERAARLVIVRDVTEHNRLQEQYLQAQKMEAIGRLAGGMAHDFNNLLTVILGYTGLLFEEMQLSRPAEAENHLRTLAEIQKAAERASVLTAQLLAFSRKRAARTKVIDVNASVRNLEGMLRRLIGEDVHLRLTLEPDAGCIRVDAGQFEQALMNLAVNARDAMPEGGLLTIETGTQYRRGASTDTIPFRPGQYTVITVSDNGHGMDEATRLKVFEPFFTTKEPGRGTGLGLAMVYGFAQQHDGIVTLESEPGLGATFQLFLPTTTDVKEETAERTPTGMLKGAGCILVVEDEPSIRVLLKEILSGAGFRVLSAEDVPEAISVAASEPGTIDLLISDVVLPGGSGPALAEQLKKTRPEMKLLFASGYSDHAALRKNDLQNAPDFVSKPFDIGTLLEHVVLLLGKRTQLAGG